MKVSTLGRGIDPLPMKSKLADLISGLSLHLRDGWSQKVSSLIYITTIPLSEPIARNVCHVNSVSYLILKGSSLVKISQHSVNHD